MITLRRLAAGLFALLTASLAQGATITIQVQDGAGEGFNDPTAATPIGGNPGTTLGQQRLNLFQAAADVWGNILDSDATIIVGAQFDPLTPCSPTSGVVGSAGTTAIGLGSDFGVGQPNTVYHLALLEALFGGDLNGGAPDINATFNSDVDDLDTCLGSGGFYYGLDGNNPPGTLLLFPVVLHELGHGLGFSSLASLGSMGTGAFPLGAPDAFSHNLFDLETNESWADMTNGERLTSSINDPDVVWTGPRVTADRLIFLTGTNGQNSGFVRMFAPDPFQGGSSVSHWTTDAFPDLLMEPILGGIDFDQVDLTVPAFEDMGWPLLSSGLIFADGFEN